MNARGLHSDARLPQPTVGSGVVHLLEALASGSCTQDEFLRKVQSLEGDDPDLPWEVLSLLDQYRRRERISQDVHASLKARLQQRFMGYGGGNAPTPTPTVPPPTTTMTPTPTPTPTAQPIAQGIPPQEPPVVVPVDVRHDRAPGVGDILRGRYRLVDILRKDASGALFEAIDQFKIDVPDVSRRIAIQVFDRSLQRDPVRLQRVCRLPPLSHPGIARLIDIDEDRGTSFLVMEWLGGVSVQRLVEQNSGARLALPTVQAIIRNVACALAYAHSQDVFHGDVSMANVMISDLGDVRLRGFDIGDRDVPANPEGDRLAFSWLAYGLLTGSRTPSDRLRKPPGVTDEQWRLLRDTMNGRERKKTGDVLAAFAGDGNAALGRVPLLQASVKTPARRLEVNGRVAAGIVTAILAVAGYFIVTKVVAPPLRATVQTPVASAPAPELAEEIVAPPNVVTTAIEPPAVASPTPVVSAPVPAPAPTRALIELPSDSISVVGDQPVARIWVNRRGRLSGEVTFLWWTETGSAQVDRDFRQITPRTAIIDSGANGVELLVPLVADSTREKPRTFYVKIDEPGSGTTLGERTLMQVLIVPPGYAEAPL